MRTMSTQWIPFLLVCLTLAFTGAAITADDAEARSKSGGRSFSSPAGPSAQPSAPPSSQFGQQRQQNVPPQAPPAAGGFGRGLMGGLLGGALGGLLFGSLFGMSGSGIGFLPILLLGVVGYFLYKRFVNRPSVTSPPSYQPPPDPSRFQSEQGNLGGGLVPPVPPVPPVREVSSLEQGLAAIRRNDPGFDEKYFLEVASDVFFKVQAGWVRRDLHAYRHLLGNQLASEYENHFAEMRTLGHINKLESIAIRKVEITAAGSDNGEDFVTVLFTANLLDYTENEKTGTLVSGSKTEPVKFAEQWTWARPIRTEDWKLEGIEVVVD